MSSSKFEKSEEKNNFLQKKKNSLRVFKLIKEEFRSYWKNLFTIILFYVIAYFIWNGIKNGGMKLGKPTSKQIYLKMILTAIAILVQGNLYSLDGSVTSWLKTPFSQVCYGVNKFEEIDEKRKKKIILLITESNEHCKETFKKFGAITMSVEIANLLDWATSDSFKSNEKGTFVKLLILSYLIPLLWALKDVFLIEKELKNIQKELLIKYQPTIKIKPNR